MTDTLSMRVAALSDLDSDVASLASAVFSAVGGVYASRSKVAHGEVADKNRHITLRGETVPVVAAAEDLTDMVVRVLAARAQLPNPTAIDAALLDGRLVARAAGDREGGR